MIGTLNKCADQLALVLYMSYNFYIYYRVPLDSATELRKQVSAMQTALANATGIKGHLQAKADEPQLWMEIYEGVENRSEFERTLQYLLTNTALPISNRTTEVFMYVE